MPDRPMPPARVFESLLAAAWHPMMDAARNVDDPSRDGGSCNMDHCVITPPDGVRVTRKMIERLNDAGCSYSTCTRWGRTRVQPNMGFGGQGANNTRTQEAIAKAGKDLGLDTWVIYVTD